MDGKEKRKKEERTMVITMASYAWSMEARMAHASRLGQKLVITMASYALQRHLVWRTQSRLT